MRTPTHVFSSNAHNRCRICGRKSALWAYWWQTKTKHVLASLDGTHAAISPIFVSAHLQPSLIFQVSSRSVQVWGNIAEKPRHDPQSRPKCFGQVSNARFHRFPVGHIFTTFEHNNDRCRHVNFRNRILKILLRWVFLPKNAKIAHKISTSCDFRPP